MKVIGIIPARYKSKRLTNKPLIQINNKPLIQLTYEAAINAKVFDTIYITTDSKKVQTIAEKFGATCILTSENNRNGTERCAELIKKINSKISLTDLIINIQCDEPFLTQEHFKKIINLFKHNTQIGTLISHLEKKEISDESIVKVNINTDFLAIDFSRKKRNWNNTVRLFQQAHYKHIGIYAYTKATLLELGELKVTERERNESLEQLRWLEYNYPIQCEFIEESLISINTKNDLKKVLKNN